MKKSLQGRRIALFESRLAEELAQMVRRSGGVPVCAPALREERRPAAREVAGLLDWVAREDCPVFVFSTGVGATALFEEARALGREDEIRGAILRGLAVCRGPKPVAVLHREGMPSQMKAQPPYTTEELLGVLVQLDLRLRAVVLVHHGEPNAALVEALHRQGARVHELLLYEWALPADAGPLVRMVGEIAAGSFAAAAFTSQIQARHLVHVAESLGKRDELLQALRERTLVAAVGPTCARALAELGVPPDIVPETPKMGAMLCALVERLSAGEAR